MAHHASAIKRIRQTATRRLRNRYYGRTTRNAIRDLRKMTDKSEALTTYNKVASMVDKLAKRGVIHKNNASNKKARMMRFVNHLS